ncbi:RNA polymerase sigma factor [Nocardioides albus]|nr:sigma-70 family RNA polymerase sigma factor [Nocardioides albus]GGU41575.1 hypothetical protein GCM10007979_46040 [Nocardioides albus]
MFEVKPSDQDVSDLVLVDRVREGDEAAYGGLWARHSDAGMRAARQISHRYDPEDLVQEAFTRVLSAIRGGKGPRDAFRPYLYASIRAVSMNWARDRAKEHTIEDLSSEVDVDAMFEDVLLEQTVTGQAFKSLRPEWRTILWYTAVEGMSAREAGPLLGLSANAAAALAYRAREGLRIGWLQAHVSSEDVDPACAWNVDRIGAYQRGGLRRKDAAIFEEHLSTCVKCTVLVRETSDLDTSLKGVLLPIILGSGIVSLDVAKGGLLAGFFVGSGTASGGASGGAASGGSAAGAAVGGTAAGGFVGGTIASVATVMLVAAAAVTIGIGATGSRTPAPGAEQSVPVADAEAWPRPESHGATTEPDHSGSAADPAPTDLPVVPSAPISDGNQSQPGTAPTQDPRNEESASPAEPGAPVETPASRPALTTPEPTASAPVEPTPTGKPLSSSPQPETTGPEPTKPTKPTEPEHPGPGTRPGSGITIVVPGGAAITLSLSDKGRGRGHKYGHQNDHKDGHQGGPKQKQQAGDPNHGDQ